MVDSDRRPTAQEIEELIDLVRRDPSSPAFIDLAEAYLALGRPRDAIQIGTVGLDAAPDNLEGRVVMARAYATLHQWKEAQGELLRVVKVDRSNRQGFALLGEVLLRRADFERAVPVLQHAQNLDPTSPQILAMLRRARAAQPLEPPNPIPQPMPPRGEIANVGDIQRSRPLGKKPVSSPPPPTPSAARADPTANSSPPEFLEPATAPRARDGKPAKPSAPPPMSVEGKKPRIIANSKPPNAAAASLRQSANVGETYLNDLLTGGLLDVAGVRVPDVEYDLRPDRRWGRSTRRMFIFLFVVLVFGFGGGGSWYWWTEKQKADAVAQLQRDSKSALAKGDFVDSLKKLQEALDKDKSNKLTFAYYVEAGGLGTLLYGETRIPSAEDPTKELAVGGDQVDQAYLGITKNQDPILPGEPGTREMAIGKAAIELSRLPTGSAKSETIKAASEQLAEVNKTLDGLLASNPEDKWARWLKGRALLAAGDRRGAAVAFKSAADGDDGLVVATIDHANVLVDDGKLDDALALFKKALDKSKDNPLAIIGQSLANSEASHNVDDVIGELNAKFVIDRLPSRVAAYRWLALASASIAIDDYKGAGEAVQKAVLGKPPSEPRFWARVAWVYYKLGRPATGGDGRHSDLVAATEARANCIFFTGKKAEPDPAMQLVDAGLLLAIGVPETVLDVAAKIDGVRPKLLRTYALLDLGRANDARALAEEILKAAPGSTGASCEADNKQANLEAKVLCEQARMLAGVGTERLQASEALAGLASAAKNQIPRHALGTAYLIIRDAPPVDARTGSNLDNAKKYLRRAIDEIKDEEPNPLVYRTYAALAEIALSENDSKVADEMVDKALAVNPWYFPTRALQARSRLRNADPDGALAVLEPIFAEPAAITGPAMLTKAEALIVRKGATAKDKDAAKQLVVAAKDRPGLQAEDIRRVAALIDPKLPDDLGLPVLDGAPKPGKPAIRRRGR